MKGGRRSTTWAAGEPPPVKSPGRPRGSQLAKEARKLTRTLFEEIVNRFAGMTKKEVTERMKDPKTPALELMVLAVVREAVVKGDQQRLGFILDRMIGKVPDRVELDDVKAPDLSKIPRDKLIAKLRKF